MLQNFHKDFVK